MELDILLQRCLSNDVIVDTAQLRDSISRELNVSEDEASRHLLRHLRSGALLLTSEGIKLANETVQLS